MTPRPLDQDTVRERLALLHELLVVLSGIGHPSAERLRAEPVTRLAVERILTQAVDLVASVCSHVASSTTRRSATTYRDAVTAAEELGMLDPELATSLRSAVGLRNVLVHEYARVDLGLVAAAVPTAARDLAAFVQQTSHWLVEQG